MSMQDPVADMFTRIRNAQAVKAEEVFVPYSKLKKNILHVLQEEGFVSGFESFEHDKKTDIKVRLNYYLGSPVIRKIRRISRCGCRVYCKADSIPVISSGLGVAIISTSKGVMTGKKAKANKLGGEVIGAVE